jgi:multidrug efflux pump subunit AcrA (membrane-fusion protein)
MTEVLSSRSQERLAVVAVRLSRRAQEHLARVQREATEEFQRKEKRRAQQLRVELQESRRIAEAVRRRAMLARQGMWNLLSIGQNEHVQQMIASLIKLGKADITFYEAGWVVGTDGRSSRDVEVSFLKTGIRIFCGSRVVGAGRDWRFSYNDPKIHTYSNLESDGNREIDLNQFIASIAEPAEFKIPLTTRPSKLASEEEWDAEWVLFQLLVDCANQSTLNRYLGKALRILWD